MRKLRFGFLIALVYASAIAHAQSNFCMDGIQNQVEHVREDGSVWYESDGMCCILPCNGYEHYTLKYADVGSSCSTQVVNNELVVGDICASTFEDQGCPEPPPSDGGSDDQGDGTDCSDPNRVGCGSPIVIDVGQQSYRLTSAADGVYFDLRNEGAPRRVAWTRAGVDNAFLALDRNGNGRIDSGAELFGNYTPLRSGGVAQHGFEALRELDDNDDGAVDRTDRAWTALLLWTDRDHDGHSTPDELAPIAGSRVTALGTSYQLVGRKDQWGNAFRYMAQAQFADGRRTYYDIYLRLSP